MPKLETRHKILIVDDNKQNIEILMDLFKDDYKVAVALDAERALKLAAADPLPDMILMDILMPGMSGYDACKILKQNDKTRGIPVIFVTAVSEVMDETQGFTVGAVDYITKPFHPPSVRARVEMHLEMRRKCALLEEYAFIDALTGIPNRRHFDDLLDKEWKRAMRADRHMSLLLIDIDKFKEYNDTYGHGSGDTALRKVAHALEDALRRAGDTVARYGGEEFAAVLPYTDAEKAREAADQIMQAVKALEIEHKSSPVAPHLTLSIGVATANPNKAATPASLLEEADKALYKAKHQGRNRIVSTSL